MEIQYLFRNSGSQVPPLYSFLSQINPRHIRMSYFFTILFNIILPPMLGFQNSLLLHFSDQNAVGTSHRSLHAECPAHLMLAVFGTEVLYYAVFSP
jgi:hypothetical protein